MGGIGVAMQTQLKWLLVNETHTFKSMAHKLGLRAKIPRTLFSTKYSKQEGRKDEENGWVPF